MLRRAGATTAQAEQLCGLYRTAQVRVRDRVRVRARVRVRVRPAQVRVRTLPG